MNGMVHDQVAAQQIYFPAQGSAVLKALPAQDAAAMNRAAGGGGGTVGATAART